MLNKKLIFWAACFGMLLFGIGLITLGSIVPDLKSKFNLDDVSAGTLFSILPIGILIGSLFFGPVCDRYGYKLILIIACIGMFAGFEGIAKVSSVGLLKLFILIFGISAGIINGATNAVVSDVSKGSEGANLSLLGVFFGIGALGMPFVIGVLKNNFSSYQIVEAVGWLTLAVGLFYSFIKFPPSKKAIGFAPSKTNQLFKENYLWFIAFFLFFQGSIESIFNNWTTTYLTKHLSIAESNALYALSLYVVGMTVMRLLIGSVLRSIKTPVLMFSSLAIVLMGILLLYFGQSYSTSIMGLILLGIGLAAGFPIMLGLAGSRYAAQSGTAFSFIFTITLSGNMLVNYLMGLISKNYGIQHFTSVAFAELLFMIFFCILIFRSQRNKNRKAETITEIQQATI
ncbi:MAG TPA: MFS transporter [Chitinophagaceae bacterium]|nr:MFS transporter [Chitinophagaceae bacterium]